MHTKAFTHKTIWLTFSVILIILFATSCLANPTLQPSTPQVKNNPTLPQQDIKENSVEKTPTNIVILKDQFIAPQIIKYNPSLRVEIAPDASIEITFDQAMDRNKTNKAISLFDPKNNSSIQGTITWSSENSFTYQPDAPLTQGHAYIFKISTEAENTRGIPLEQPFVLDILVADNLQITKVFPENGAQDVASDTLITVMFNRPVVPLGIKEEKDKLPQPLIISPSIEGIGEWVDTSVYVFHPSQPLLSAQTYRVAVKPSFKDQLGMSLKDEYIWEFTTVSPSIEALELPDFAYNPQNNIKNVPLEQTFIIYFRQPMNRQSVEESLSFTNKNGENVDSELSWDKSNTFLKIKPRKLLTIDTEYSLTLSKKAQAQGGGELQEGLDFKFATYPLPGIKTSHPKNGETQKEYSNWYSIEFLSPMDLNSLKGKIIISPELETQEGWSYNQWNWSIEGYGLAPSTKYTIRILPGISDRYGNKTDKEFTITFTTAPLRPFAYLQMPHYPAIFRSNDKEMAFYTRWANLNQLDFYLYSLTLQDIISLERGNLPQYLPSSDKLIKKWSLNVKAEKNSRQLTKQLLVTDGGNQLKPGFYFLSIDSPQLSHEMRQFADYRVLIVSDVNLTIKHNNGSPSYNSQGDNTISTEALVWMTDLSSGEPIPNSKINFYDGNLKLLGNGITDNEGIIHFQKSIQLVSEKDDNDSLWLKSVRYAITDPADPHFAFASTDWGSGVSPYDFGIWSDYYEPAEGFNAYIYTERPIYRPSQPVYFKGIVRWNNDLSYEIPNIKEVLVKVENYQETIFEENLPLNSMGAFSGKINLDSDAALGSYAIRAYIPKNTNQSLSTSNEGDLIAIGEISFNVAAYRKPEFQVEVSISENNVLANENFFATMASTYYSGGAVKGADIEWKLVAEAYRFIPASDYSSFSFVDEDLDSENTTFDSTEPKIDIIAEGKSKTNDEGKIILPFTADLTNYKTSRLFTFEATLTDAFSNQVSGRAKTIAHRSLFYPGIKTDKYLGEVDKTQNVEGVVLDWNNKPIANQSVDIEIYERRWSSVQEQNPEGIIEWKTSVENIPIKSFINIKTDENGKVNVPFVPLKGGTYKLLIKTQDSKGNVSQASTFLWVAGKDYISWRQTNNRSIDLIADKSSYKVGDTAEILITTPFEKSVYVLLTIERGKIHSYKVTQLTKNNAVLSLPITKDMIPNVYISVIVIGNVEYNDQANATLISDFRIGMKEIKVSPEENELILEISANKESVEPGDDISYTIYTKDRSGKPIQAELSVSVSDLATLSLLPMNSRPIVEYFYQHKNLGIRTTVPIVLLIDHYNASIQDYITDGKGGGGGGGKGDSTLIGVADIRENFPDTAFWQPHILTDAEGKAIISFKYPDNTTTWRLDARAITKDTKVGQITYDTLSTKSLLLKPQTPRFFINKDKAWIGTIIQNNTKEDIDVSVSLETQGATIIEKEGNKAIVNTNIPSFSQKYVPWLIEVQADAQYVDLVFTANGGGYQDKTRPTIGSYIPGKGLPVYSYQVFETVGTAGVLTSEDAQGKTYAAKTEGIILPSFGGGLATKDMKGDLKISIAPSLMAGFKDGLNYLTYFPYECTEQLVSKFIPNVLTMKAMKALSLEDKALESQLNTQMNVAYQRLSKLQNTDGGWGWWGNQSSDPLTTAYVIFGFTEAKENGFYVNDELIKNGVTFLKTNLKPLPSLSDPTEANRQAFILYVLSNAKQSEPSYVSQLYKIRESLGLYGKAYLAMAISMDTPNDDRLKTLRADFVNTAITSATGAHWEEKIDDFINWNTDTRTTALVLKAMLMIDKDNPLNANAVRWLMSNRTLGRWKTTQETVWSLHVLTDWMLYNKELDVDYEFALSLNGNLLIPNGWQKIEKRALRSLDQLQEPLLFHTDIANMEHEKINQLTIARTAGIGNLYYTAHLDVTIPVEKVSPLNQGIIISRNYYDPKDQRVGIQKTQQGNLVFVRLTIVAPNDLNYVVIEDPLPAGLEAIDRSLLTSAQFTAPETPEQTVELTLDMPWLKNEIPSWGWQFFDHVELKDEKVLLSATTLPKGTYTYTYLARATTKGEFHVIPPTAQEFYFPEVYGRGNGSIFIVE